MPGQEVSSAVDGPRLVDVLSDKVIESRFGTWNQCWVGFRRQGL